MQHEGGQGGGRIAFQSRALSNFGQSRVETIAVGASGERLFVGTSDG
jgi:hypothetical protein